MDKDYKYGNVRVKVVDKNPEQRQEHLKKVVEKFITKVKVK